MDNKMKNAIVMAVAVPLLGYFCYDIYTQLFPSPSASPQNVPASMESLPSLPQSASPPSVNPQNTPASPGQPPKQEANRGPKPDPKTDPKANANAAEKPIVLASNNKFGSNPFVEMSTLTEESKLEKQSMLPAIPNNTPAPNVSNVPIPPPPSGVSIPTPPDGVTYAAPVVTGTIETSSGEKISLMSDGKVVSDTSDDGIAYIGGGDVRMNEGRSIDDLVNSIQVNRKQ